MSKRICSLSSLFFLTCLAIFAEETIATAGTLTTCNNGITISFMISMVITQFVLAFLIGMILAKVNALDEKKNRNSNIQFQNLLPRTFQLLDCYIVDLLRNQVTIEKPGKEEKQP